MAKDKKETDVVNETKEEVTASRIPLTINGQYVKDLSFENPNAPESMRPGKGQPQVDINFTMDAKKLELDDIENMYEVALTVTAKSERDGQVAFIVEVEYGVLVTIDTATEEQVHPLLLIEVPRHAFPFVRQIIATTTQEAGFMPLMLQPVDFRRMYMERYAQENPTADAKAESA